jgi:hypothetical protein
METREAAAYSASSRDVYLTLEAAYPTVAPEYDSVDAALTALRANGGTPATGAVFEDFGDNNSARKIRTVLGADLAGSEDDDCAEQGYGVFQLDRDGVKSFGLLRLYDAVWTCGPTALVAPPEDRPNAVYVKSVTVTGTEVLKGLTGKDPAASGDSLGMGSVIMIADVGPLIGIIRIAKQGASPATEWHPWRLRWR